MYGYVYKTTNLINNKIYIGQHKSSIYDSKYLGSGKNIYKAIKKYGKSNFTKELLEWCDTQQDADKKEIYYINLFNSTDTTIGYNITLGGQSRFFTGMKHSDESKIKMSEKAKARPDKHEPTSLNYKWIHFGTTNKTVPIDELQEYLNNGWELGRFVTWTTWNKGLTKETDERVDKYTKSRNKHFENGESIGCFGVKNNTNGFIKGNIPWNKGLKDYNKGHPYYGPKKKIK